MDDPEKDVKIRAALDAAELASKFMKSQMSAFSMLNFGNPPMEINWSIYYQFAAGVYDCVSQAFEKKYQYDLQLAIAALPAFVGNDLTAASKVHSAMKTPRI